MSRTRLAVLGHPVAHSRSPAMQTAALRDLGLEAWSYEAIDVEPSRFEQTVRELAEAGFRGVNVTIPHKAAALAIADRASEAAEAIGAANTLSFDGKSIAADNTDAPGMIAALEMPDLRGSRTLVLGAGGTARAAVWALANVGAEARIVNRTPERAAALATELGATAISPEEVNLGEVDLLINTTSVGLDEDGHPSNQRRSLAQLGLSVDQLGDRHTVVDFVYGDAGTVLTQVAKEAGANVIDGLEILVRQGAASLEIWTGKRPALEPMRLAARAGGAR